MFYSKPWADLLIALLVVLLFVGPKRLPSLGRSLGQGFREFKDGITGATKDEEERRPAIAPVSEQPASAEPAAASTAQHPESAEVGSTEQRA